ncbi:sigma 54-interacting transcriptional regulator [Spongiibacter sp. KMU-166]|uniref:Sigma 54-interacting transcriptional regulator n=1 Tax=Spongiibacter thalassae TaxID=2721624 RepID=A0ABX1GD99_9GAMM|nr:sigma 54-interacting transcriptional regulator [Spongiibacter thalassae]NKI17128.1 sigma 54-interacting transcriptional regulator [Spongiibacter thalassae]
MSHNELLLVDDDPELLELLSMRLSAMGYRIHCAESGEQALRILSTEKIHLVISDLCMDGMDGLALFEAIQVERPGLPVILLTAHGSIQEAVTATQRGVFGFLTKPVDKRELLDVVNRALSVQAPEPRADWAKEIIGGSAAIRQLLDQAQRVARSPINILIQGASGTGKELLARALHRASDRADQAFVAINCSAIPAELLESELFGHVKGAFSGAVRDHEGLFVSADGGTVFLDEIGDMPLALQAKLLRVLQEKSLRPVGGTRDRHIDVRVLSATHRDLHEAITAGDFREDLFYRLNAVVLTLPTLAERPSDIPLLAAHFLKSAAERHGSEVKNLSPSARATLINYPWPGNIRQLANVIEQLVVLTPGPVISNAQLQACLPAASQGKPLPKLAEARAEFEQHYLRQLLANTGGNMSQAAKVAGRNRSDFYKLVKKHGIDPERLREQARMESH